VGVGVLVGGGAVGLKVAVDAATAAGCVEAAVGGAGEGDWQEDDARTSISTQRAARLVRKFGRVCALPVINGV
jgi:hypothetical protein